jgi:WD40 repeat protein
LAVVDLGIKIIDLATGNGLFWLNNPSELIESIALSPTQPILASVAKAGNTITLWNIENGEKAKSLTGHSNVMSLAFAKDGKTLASGGWDGTIKFWSVDAGTQLETFDQLKMY